MTLAHYLIPAGALVLALSSCGTETDQSADMDHSGHDMSAMESGKAKGKKGGLDYKAMFGPDYKKGDVGHSTGTVLSIAPDSGYITIDHGMIHGIGMGAMTMAFEVLSEADLSGISAGAKVEFLVKKGSEGNYSLFALCNMDTEGEQCLKKTFG